MRVDLGGFPLDRACVGINTDTPTPALDLQTQP